MIANCAGENVYSRCRFILNWIGLLLILWILVSIQRFAIPKIILLEIKLLNCSQANKPDNLRPFLPKSNTSSQPYLYKSKESKHTPTNSLSKPSGNNSTLSIKPSETTLTKSLINLVNTPLKFYRNFTKMETNKSTTSMP